MARPGGAVHITLQPAAMVYFCTDLMPVYVGTGPTSSRRDVQASALVLYQPHFQDLVIPAGKSSRESMVTTQPEWAELARKPLMNLM
jgi:hypothetical protein